MRILISFLLSFFRTIYLFEGKKNKKKKFFQDLEIINHESTKNIKSLEILRYLKTNNKLKRFKKKQILLALLYKKKPISYGWMYEGNTWNIDEIDQILSIKNNILLFDFETIDAFRNKGYYAKFLILIKNIKKNKTFYIYSLGSNKHSKKGILNAGFNLKHKLKRFL